MKTKKEAILELEEVIMGRWEREDKQMYLFFKPTANFGEWGELHASEQLLLVAVTPPIKYKIVLGELNKAQTHWHTELHTLDEKTNEEKKYEIYWLSSGMEKLELINEKQEKMYFRRNPTGIGRTLNL